MFLLKKKTEMVSPAEALPGRPDPIPTAETHFVNGHLLKPPFPDGLQVLVDGGVRAVVEPGGSVRDEEVIAAAKEAGLTLYFTGTRHFFH